MSAARRFFDRHPDAICLGIVLLAATVFKLGFALRLVPFIAKDSQAYFLPAWDLVHSGQFELGLRRTPAYPLFLSGALLLTGDDLRGIVLLQHLLGIVTAALAFLLGRLVVGENAGAGRIVGVVAGLLSAISAPLVTYEHYLLTETLFAFSVTAMLVGLVWAWRRDSARLWLLGGVSIGLAAMVKPVAQGFLPLALLAAYATTASWRPVFSTSPRKSDCGYGEENPLPLTPIQPTMEPLNPHGPVRGRGGMTSTVAPLPRKGEGLGRGPVLATEPMRYCWELVLSSVFWPAPTLRTLLVVIMVVVGYGCAVAPWSIRNQLAYNLASPSTFGRTMIARTASYDRGFVFADPSRPESDPRMVRAARIVQQGADRSDSDGTIAQRLRQDLDLDPIEVNALMRDLAIRAIVRQPLYFVDGSLRFALRIFNGVELRLRDHEAERKDVEWNERTRHLLVNQRSEDDARAANSLLKIWQPALWAPLPLVLFILGIATSLRPSWRPGLLVGAAVGFLVIASAALNGPQERYRYPVDPATAVLMAAGVVGLTMLAWRAWLSFARRSQMRSASVVTIRPMAPLTATAPAPRERESIASPSGTVPSPRGGQSPLPLGEG